MMIVDTHVHLYPTYDLGFTLRLCAVRLHALAPDAVPLVCLTERHDCHVFSMLRAAGRLDSEYVLGIELLEGGRSLVVRFGQGIPPLFIVPGRQIATQDRLEVHCLGMDATIPDGQQTGQTIKRVLEVDGLAVLPWGVGKWLFHRRKVVDRLLESFGLDQLFLGDSTMRSWVWPEPIPMRTARMRGYRVLAGSDPLPHETTGRWIGRYATLLDAAFSSVAPAQSCLNGLRTGTISVVGRRPGPIGAAIRMLG